MRVSRYIGLAREETLSPLYKMSLYCIKVNIADPRWPRGLRRGSSAARLMGLRVRIPPAAWMSVYCECWILLGSGLCDGPIPRPEGSYRVCARA
jgi:hypothetical protein